MSAPGPLPLAEAWLQAHVEYLTRLAAKHGMSEESLAVMLDHFVEYQREEG